MAAFVTLPVAKAIACLGDSITFMASSRADRPYPAVLDELLYEDGLQVANHGIGGVGIATSQLTYATYLKSRGLWGVVLMIGVNDLAAGTPGTTIFTSINALVQEMLGDGLRVVLCTVLPWKNGGGWTAPIQTQTEALNTAIRGLIGTNSRLRVADGYAAFGQVDDPALLQTGMQALGELDGLHLGSYGAQAFARFVLEEGIEPLLLEPDPVPNGLKNPAYDIVQFLTTKTVGGVLLTAASNLFIGRMPDNEKTASPCVSVLNTGGGEPQSMLSGERQSVYTSSVQVLVRSAVDDFAAGEALGRGVIEWCHQRVVTGYLSWYARDSQPALLGPDASGRLVWAINFDAEYLATLG